jgi:cold shock protein
MSQFTGTVSWFNNGKGFGFLKRAIGPDVFVHYTSIQHDGYKSLKEGDTVEFDVIRGEKGPQADQVRRVELVTVLSAPEATHVPIRAQIE